MKDYAPLMQCEHLNLSIAHDVRAAHSQLTIFALHANEGLDLMTAEDNSSSGKVSCPHWQLPLRAIYSHLTVTGQTMNGGLHPQDPSCDCGINH